MVISDVYNCFILNKTTLINDYLTIPGSFEIRQVRHYLSLIFISDVYKCYSK